MILVIDASVARAAGETEHPTSSACREVLLEALRICHRAVLTDALAEEWSRHQSRFTRKWRTSMAARRKNVERINAPPHPQLRTLIAGLPQSGGEILLKDAHLIEAAILSDRIILSLDDTTLQYLRAIARLPGSIQDVLWIHPVRDQAKLIAFLKGESPPDEAWTL